MSEFADFPRPEAENEAGLKSVRVDNEVFFKQGTIEVHFPAARGNDTQLNRVEAAALTRAANRVDILKRNFIEGVTPVFRRQVGEDGMVQIMAPSSPYAYGGVMVVAASPKLLAADEAAPETVVRTETAFDLTSEMRIEYYKQILASIQAEEDTLLPNRDNGKVMAYENTVPSISNEDHRLPRTIALPHMHVLKGGEWVNESVLPPRPHGFSLEQKIAQDEELFGRFRDEWFIPYVGTLPLDDSEMPSLEMRSRTPYGYTIASKITRDSMLEKQARDLSDLLIAHHAAYSDFATQEAQRTDDIRAQRRHDSMKKTGTILPPLPSVAETLPLQPSYRTYLYYRDGLLTATISPIFITTLGAMEGMESAINRGLHHEKAFTDEEMTLFFERLSGRLRTLLDDESNRQS
jgi:hypothetical protein